MVSGAAFEKSALFQEMVRPEKNITWTNGYGVLTRKYLYKISIIKMRYINNK